MVFIFSSGFNAQINDDRIILDKTVADQVSIWKKSKGLGDNVVNDHACSGKTCAYHQIGDVFVCEKTGNVHGKKMFATVNQPFDKWKDGIPVGHWFVLIGFLLCTWAQFVMTLAGKLYWIQ